MTMRTLSRYRSSEAAVRAIIMSDMMRSLPPIACRFFSPNDKFARWAAERAGERIVYDVGAGEGHVTARLAAGGVKALALDLRENTDPASMVFAADGGAYKYTTGSVVMLCRPCHGDFPREVIRRAIECGASEVWYVGLAKNAANDLYGHRSRFKYALRGAGDDGENVYVMEVSR